MAFCLNNNFQVINQLFRIYETNLGKTCYTNRNKKDYFVKYNIDIQRIIFIFTI